MKLFKGIGIGAFLTLFFLVCFAGQTGFHAIIFRGGEYPEITFNQGETISNETDGALDFGAANLTTTGTLTASGAFSSAGASAIFSGSGAYIQGDNFYLGYSTPDSETVRGTIRLKVFNKQSGGTDISAKDVVQWDTTQVEIAADTTKDVTVRLTNNILFSCYAWVRCIRPATTNADTLYIWGDDAGGNSCYEAVVGPAGSQQYIFSNNLYASIDSMKICITGGNSGNYQFDGYYLNAVKASAGSNNLVCGVATAAIGDSGGTGYIVIRGFARATVDAATLNAYQGTLLTGASGGDAVTIASATADSTKNAKILGYTMQPGYKDNTDLLIFVDPK